MFRKIATAVAILVTGLAVGAPAFALLGGTPERPKLTSTEPGSSSGASQGGASDATTTTVKHSEPHPPASGGGPAPTTGAEPSTTTTKPAEPAKPTTTTTPSEEHRALEALRLACTGGRSGDVGGVRCEWSPSHAPTFARYVLWRQDPGATQKRVVFQTTDINVLQFGDKPLAPGTYTYGLLALDGANKGVGAGGPTTAIVPAPPAPSTTTPAQPGTTTLACHTEAMTVVCTWPMSTSERFGAYRLYRELPGTPAQLRRTITDRNTTTATDGDVQPGATYKYRIVVVDGSGQTLAASAPVTVTIPA